MRHALLSMPRAIQRVHAQPRPEEILAGLAAAQTEFMDRHKSRLDTVEASLDDITTRLAAGNLNGSGGGSRSSAARAALEAFGQFGRTGDVAAMSAMLPRGALRTDSDPDGGYLIPEEVAGEIYSLQRNISPIRRLAKVVPTRGKAYKHPINRGGSATGWVGETDARPTTEAMKMAMLEFPAGEIYANPGVTQAMLDDTSFPLGEFLSSELSREFDEKEGVAFVNGNGIKKPRGFLDYETYVGAGNADWGKIQAVHSGHASDFLSADPSAALTDVLYSLKAAHRSNSTWLMNSATQARIAKWKDADGNLLFKESVSVGMPPMLLGRPVATDENMPDVGANAFPVALGNWQAGYLINDRMEVRILRDPFSNKPYVHFYTTKRVGGGVLDFEAIKLLKISA